MTDPVRIAAYGLFGIGNLGNEGSLEALLAYLRAAHPTARVHCIAPAVDEVRRDHGIRTERLMAYRPRPGRHPVVDRLAAAGGRLWDVPRTFAMMRDVDVLVVPGTGVLEVQLTTRAWATPYWLLVTALACRLRRRRFVLLSIGAEASTSRWTRWLFRSTARLADHCSFRDEFSVDAARECGVEGVGPPVPDLAFALPTPPPVPAEAGLVVIGVMTYDGAYDDPHRGPDVVARYVERMAEVVARLARAGDRVTLVVGDVADDALAERIVAGAEQVQPGAAASVTVSPAHDLDGLLQVMAPAEVVVASRFHNLICALKLGKPTISLSYAPKNGYLLAEFGLAGLEQPMDGFDVELLLEQVRRARGLPAEQRARIRQRLDEQARELARELRQLSDLVDGVRAPVLDPAQVR